MNKKVILSLIIVNIVLCIPTQQSQSILTFPVIDAAGDVMEIQNGVAVGTVTYNPIDIDEIDKFDLDVDFTMHGVPILNSKHFYNVTIYWDTSYWNYSICLAGAATSYVPVKSGGILPLFNGTYTIIRHANSTILATALESDLILPVIGNSILFNLNSSSLALPTTTKDYFGIFSSAHELYATAQAKFSAVYPKLLESKAVTCWFCDTAGSGFCWIPFPDDCGGIETPIIIGLVGSSFVFISVMRRRKRK